VVGGATTLYWPGAGSLLDESDGAGIVMARQVHLDGVLVYHQSIAGNGAFIFPDHLGSTRVTADATGNVKDDIDYYPFGGVVANYGSSPSDNHYLFTGYESDASESSTDYATFRNLSMSMGRFNRPDPYDGSYDPTDPQSLNRYAYVRNRPLASIDRFGLEDNQVACTEGNLDSCPSGDYVDQYGDYYYWDGSTRSVYNPTNVEVNSGDGSVSYDPRSYFGGFIPNNPLPGASVSA
jgi:RHS repeat-associated protein